MSVEDLHAFFKRLETDESLRQEVIALEAASGEERFAALHAVALREGFEVTAEDWRHESVGPAVAELEDEELRTVVAAGCTDNAGLAGSLGFGESGCGQSLGAYGGGCGQSLGAYGGGCGQSAGAAAHNGCA